MKLSDALLLGLGAVGAGFAVSRVLANDRHGTAISNLTSPSDPASASVLDTIRPSAVPERSPMAKSQPERGLVVPLSPQQIVNRALYLAGEAKASILDSFVREPAPECTTIYYRLAYPNGGTDPTAKDPAARWMNDAKTFTFITADCVAGATWNGGFDRFQKKRGFPFYGGAINTDSVIMDAIGPKICFVADKDPSPGAFCVCKSGSPGHEVGHIMTITSVPSNWDPAKRQSWLDMAGVDIANRKSGGVPVRANRKTTGVGWFGTRALFVRSIMQP